MNIPRLHFLYLAVVIFLLLPVSLACAEPPNRIISIAPNLTEILYALGLGDRVVGVTTFCDKPEEAKKKPKVGGMSNPSLETIAALKPDIVVLTTDGNLREFEERLRSLKIRTYVFKVRKLSELPGGIRDMGCVLGRKEKAYSIAREIEAELKMSSLSSLPAEKKKVMFIVWPEPLIVAGPGTATDEAITLLGHRNIASGAGVSYPKYSIEAVIRQSPDVIFIGSGHTGIKKMSGRLLKKLASVPAVKNGNVFFIGDDLYRMGPGVVKGIREMSACLK
jgi:iron complex transport system substrate-binding protein